MSRRPGRPSLVETRRRQIIDAYIRLVAESNDPDVSVSKVAEQAGVARTAIAHFVGTRDELVTEAIIELGRRYEYTLRRALGEEPTIDRLLEVLFHPAWVDERDVEDRAFDVLRNLTERDSEARSAVRTVYQMLVGELESAIRRATNTDGETIADAAYTIACIAEFNPFLRMVGFSAERSAGARRVATAIVDELRES